MLRLSWERVYWKWFLMNWINDTTNKRTSERASERTNVNKFTIEQQQNTVFISEHDLKTNWFSGWMFGCSIGWSVKRFLHGKSSRWGHQPFGSQNRGNVSSPIKLNMFIYFYNIFTTNFVNKKFTEKKEEMKMFSVRLCGDRKFMF